MEFFYFLFEDLNHWDIWDQKGYSTGLIILFATTILVTVFYYLLLGRKTMRFSTLGGWFVFGLSNFLLVFIITLFAQGFGVFELAFGDFFYEIWIFSLLNAIYGFVLYIFASLFFKRFSIFSKFIPVKF